MDRIEENQTDAPSVIFKSWPIDWDDDEEFRAGYPFELNPLEEIDELQNEGEKESCLVESSTESNNYDDSQQSVTLSSSK
ncbi:unnamed protein product [Adineta ricciae]|uniref:Uncharacterized protein n=1 Tax=Adineta ricciae TaxID=249248 RepID=A0A815NZR1_ADIRI|nr:unnamed protein product [Adineta ricciae]